MKKLTMKVDELRIERFEVEEAYGDERGTVQGFDSAGTSCVWRLCTGAPITYSCDDTSCC